MLSIKGRRISPSQIVLIGFLLLILAGTGLLMLPAATVSRTGTPFSEALFTATSATCVTGLVVHDTALYWSAFGQAVILLLIQVGGMGVVTMAVAIFMFAGRRIGVRQRWVMQESISAPQVGGIVRITGFILKTALLIEVSGAVLLALRFCPQFGFWKGIWYGLFHSISAFCNAGFDLMGAAGPFSSLTDYTGDVLVNTVVMLLILVGGIGFMTWNDIREKGLHIRAYRLQSKLILIWTLFLLTAAAAYFFFYEFRLPQWDTLTNKGLAALFQAVTPRTAGFNTVDLTLLSGSGRAVMILLMLIGSAPGSTAGGFKTTTLAVLLLFSRAVFRRRSAAQSFGRRIPEMVLRNAAAIFVLYLILFFLGGVLICCIENVELTTALFEAASAVGTVGLSLGITPELRAAARLILVVLMYFGRVGGLTLIYAVASGAGEEVSQLPQEDVTVG